jgi:intraflagellar transport protein 122
VLVSLKKTDVYVKRWPTPGIRNQYYKLLMPEIPVILCTSCNHFFHEEDYEIASIAKNRCPICRAGTDKVE